MFRSSRGGYGRKDLISYLGQVRITVEAKSVKLIIDFGGNNCLMYGGEREASDLKRLNGVGLRDENVMKERG